MWMMELAMNTNTADSRIGIQRDVRATILSLLLGLVQVVPRDIVREAIRRLG
jgi:hypothetical protein